MSMYISPLLALSAGWEDATVTDVVAILSVELITAMAFFFAGAMVGSFFNVVLYRMPLRKNVLWPPSSCPFCGHRIALADNVPVIGWLVLRGRCRYCKASIPREYLRVEIMAGLLSLALLYLVIHTGGGNLPLRPPEQYGGALWTIWYPRPQILSIHGYFCILAFSLLGVVLFARQGERLPGAVVGLALLVGVGLAWRHPVLQQVPWAGQGNRDGAAEALLGLAVGGILGAGLALTAPRRTLRDPSRGPLWPLPVALDLLVCLALIGTWFGWQGVVSVAVLTATALALLGGRLPAVFVAAVAAAVHFALWRILTTNAPWWPGPHTSPPLMAAWVALALALGAISRFRGRAAAPPPEVAGCAEARPEPAAPADPQPAKPAAPAE